MLMVGLSKDCFEAGHQAAESELPLAQLQFASQPANETSLQDELQQKFDLRLKSDDSSVIPEIIKYNQVCSGNSASKQEIYEWLQNHQSRLAAEAVRAVGLNEAGFVAALMRIADGRDRDRGNSHAAARQIYEIATTGTLAGVAIKDATVVDEALRVWQENHALLSTLAEPVALPEFPSPGLTTPGTLLIIRHGQVNWAEGLFNKWAGWLQSTITDEGRHDAAAVGLASRDLHLDRAYQSDLIRAKETLAEFIKGRGGEEISVITAPSLRERCYGFMAGWSRKDVEDKFGKELFDKWRRSLNGRPPGGESLSDTIERVAPYFLKEILPAVTRGENVVVSAHGNSLRAILILLRNHTRAINGETPLSNEEISKLEVPLSTPITIRFDKKLKSEETWSKAG